MPNRRKWYASVAVRRRGGEGELLLLDAAAGLCGAGLVLTALIAHRRNIHFLCCIFLY